jgi:hypothetical protein
MSVARYRQREFLYGDELEHLDATADWFTLRTVRSTAHPVLMGAQPHSPAMDCPRGLCLLAP